MRIFSTANFLFKSTIREKSYIFWLLAFPVILLIMLITVFSSFFSIQRITFNLDLIKDSQGPFSDIIDEIFQKISRGEDKVFNLRIYKDYFKDKLIEDLKTGKTQLIIEVPKDFDSLMFTNLTLQSFGINFTPPVIKIYSSKHRSSSQTVSLIVRNIFQKLELEFIKKTRDIKEYPVENAIVGVKKEFSYVDFIYPGIVIFSIFMTGLFGIGEELTWYRERKILKRFYITPISSLEFFLSFFLSRFYLFIIQVILLSIICKFIYKSTVNPFSLPFIIYTLLSMITLSSLGFFLSAIAKNTNSANVLAQLLNFPLQFLGGIYFPVNQVPWIIKWIVIINPITYLTSGIRDILGILESPYPLYLTILIPIFWSIVFISLAINKYKVVEH
ncbi:MAG: ABC transporter permease [Dictyoglomaceae bacterium]